MASTRQYAQPRPAAALLSLGYAAVVYATFLAVLGYAIGFFAGAGVPKGIDQGPRSPWAVAVAIDLLLLLLFAVQHTVMARPWFKRRWTQLVPVPAERATFVLCANLLLAALFWLWRPVGGTIWHLPGPAADGVLALYAVGWAVAVGSTFMINHFDLFGLRQAYLHARRRLPPAAVHRARPVPVDPASPHGRVRDRLLGRAGDDGGAPAVRRRRDRLHPAGHQARAA
jgi:protein-S-isoprenylcysteine O-methyltransferase Ste14